MRYRKMYSLNLIQARIVIIPHRSKCFGWIRKWQGLMTENDARGLEIGKSLNRLTPQCVYLHMKGFRSFGFVQFNYSMHSCAAMHIEK